MWKEDRHKVNISFGNYFGFDSKLDVIQDKNIPVIWFINLTYFVYFQAKYISRTHELELCDIRIHKTVSTTQGRHQRAIQKGGKHFTVNSFHFYHCKLRDSTSTLNVNFYIDQQKMILMVWIFTLKAERFNINIECDFFIA
jgi:hypothetical protein